MLEFYRNSSGDIFHYAYFKGAWRVFLNGEAFKWGESKLIRYKNTTEARQTVLNCSGGYFVCNANSYEEAIAHIKQKKKINP